MAMVSSSSSEFCAMVQYSGWRSHQRAKTRSSQRAARIDYKESSEGDGEDEGSKRKKVVPALHEGIEELDDEVEKILLHRESGETQTNDPWASKELYVKWKRWAYIHCSWETRLTLSQLKGANQYLADFIALINGSGDC